MSDSQQKQSQRPTSIFVACTWIREAEIELSRIVSAEIVVFSTGIDFVGQLKVFEFLIGSSQNEKCSAFVGQLEVNVIQLLQLCCGKFSSDCFVFVRFIDDRLTWTWIGEPIIIIE